MTLDCSVESLCWLLTVNPHPILIDHQRSYREKYLLDSIFLKHKSAMRIIANVHQIQSYLTDTRALCKTFNSLFVYFNSIYGYQKINNSVPVFVSNVFISVNSRYPRRDIFKFNPCYDIKINTSIGEVNDLPVSFRSMTRLSCFKRSLFNYMYLISLL